MNKFLYWLSGFLPCRIISDGIERYYLFTLLGWRFYLHRFIGSDPDRGLHDHPWSKAYSVILSGWYYEETRSGTRKVRWFNSLTGDTFHRVVLPNRVSDGYYWPCWTLFMHKVGDVKVWGFIRDLETDILFADQKNNPAIKGAFLFIPYSYPKGFIKTNWWENAKRRKDYVSD